MANGRIGTLTRSEGTEPSVCRVLRNAPIEHRSTGSLVTRTGANGRGHPIALDPDRERAAIERTDLAGIFERRVDTRIRPALDTPTLGPLIPGKGVNVEVRYVVRQT